MLASIRERLIEESEKVSEVILAETLDFMLFLKARADKEYMVIEVLQGIERRRPAENPRVEEDDVWEDGE